jgi:hypothetical membrane protein
MGSRASGTLALAGPAAPFWILGASLAVGATRPEYNPVRNAISELGATGCESPLLWNVLGFGVTAVLLAIYAALVWEAVGGWMFGLAAAQATFVAGAGIFRCDAGCPQVSTTTTGWLHTFFGGGFFAMTTVLPFVAWRVMKKKVGLQRLAPASLATGMALAIWFFSGPLLGHDRVGLWQRVFLLVFAGWQTAVALGLRRVVSESRGP